MKQTTKRDFIKIFFSFLTLSVTLGGSVGVAFADSGAAGSGFASGIMGQMGLLGAFLLIFYFMIFHPQNKKAKEHREMITRLAKGDEIIINGGIVGRINRVTDDFFWNYGR